MHAQSTLALSAHVSFTAGSHKHTHTGYWNPYNVMGFGEGTAFNHKFFSSIIKFVSMFNSTSNLLYII